MRRAPLPHDEGGEQRPAGATGDQCAAVGPALPGRLVFDLDPALTDALLADGRPSYLVIDPVAIDGQWAGRSPALTVEAIRASRGLTRIDEAGAWTLYRIGSP